MISKKPHARSVTIAQRFMLALFVLWVCLHTYTAKAAGVSSSTTVNNTGSVQYTMPNDAQPPLHFEGHYSSSQNRFAKKLPQGVLDIMATVNKRMLVGRTRPVPAEVRSLNPVFNDAALVRSAIFGNNKDMTDYRYSKLTRQKQKSQFCGWVELQEAVDFMALDEGLTADDLLMIQERALRLVPVDESYRLSISLIRTQAGMDIDNGLDVDEATGVIYRNCMDEPTSFGGLISK